MHDKSIIVIGGGIAGLSVGCYGRMNGFRMRIFEMHNLPGGLCTSWKRQGYTVDGCIHWLAGSNPQSKLYRLWEELGAVQGREFIYAEEYGRIESADGKTFIIYSDIDRLKQHMKEIAPEDNKVIDEFINAVWRCTRFEPPIEKAPEVYGLLDMLNLIITQFPLLRMLWKWNRISLTQFGMRFKSPLLREAFPLMSMPEFPMFFMLMTFALMHNKAAGYPVGGSLEFSRAIEKRYLAIGGKINYKAKVTKILVERGRAVGVKLEDGTEHYADYIISAADSHATIFEMLEGKYVDDTIKGYYNNLIPFPPMVYLALGVDRRSDDMPRCIGDTTIQLKDQIMIGGKEQKCLSIHIYNVDPTLAPAGKTLLTVMFHADYDYWKKLRENDEQYKAEKETIADIVVSLLDKRFPGLAAQVEMRDVATPTTFERYTGNWKGSSLGWQVTSKTRSFSKFMQKTLPGLENFYMAGQWVAPGGGVPNAAMSGRNVIQIICKKEKRRFTTTTDTTPTITFC
jgi:phytoene dehydrogenase-like protein